MGGEGRYGNWAGTGVLAITALVLVLGITALAEKNFWHRLWTQRLKHKTNLQLSWRQLSFAVLASRKRVFWRTNLHFTFHRIRFQNQKSVSLQSTVTLTCKLGQQLQYIADRQYSNKHTNTCADALEYNFTLELPIIITVMNIERQICKFKRNKLKRSWTLEIKQMQLFIFFMKKVLPMYKYINTSDLCRNIETEYDAQLQWIANLLTSTCVLAYQIWKRHYTFG